MNDLKTIVLSNREIAPGYFRMKILAPGYRDVAQPGQFVMLRVKLAMVPLLRRPFGIYRIGSLPPDCEGMAAREYIEIIYKVVGEGTKLMQELSPGDPLELLGPLGKGFNITSGAPENILVGGGIGLVPLYMLAEQLMKDAPVTLLMGGRSRNDAIVISDFEQLGVTVEVTTEDGSLGERGLVTQILERKLGRNPTTPVFACGPMPMLEAVEKICRRFDAALQVSLEALMACGVGACLGCVVKGSVHSDDNPQYLCTCSQGPVFAAEDLKWGRDDALNPGCGGCQ